jgi:hypothetical protein
MFLVNPMELIAKEIQLLKMILLKLLAVLIKGEKGLFETFSKTSPSYTIKTLSQQMEYL